MPYLQHLHVSVFLLLPSSRFDFLLWRNCFNVFKNMIMHVCDIGPLFCYIEIWDICMSLQLLSIPDRICGAWLNFFFLLYK
jgi:hypothetical protein